MYRWTLNFTKTCNGGLDNGGVTRFFCLVDDTSLVPVIVTGYTFTELDQDNQVVKNNSTFPVIPLWSGGVLTFTSQLEIPKGFQATLIAENLSGEEIELEWFVIFSNLCEIDPFAIGDNMGWMVLVSTRKRRGTSY